MAPTHTPAHHAAAANTVRTPTITAINSHHGSSPRLATPMAIAPSMTATQAPAAAINTWFRLASLPESTPSRRSSQRPDRERRRQPKAREHDKDARREPPQERATSCVDSQRSRRLGQSPRPTSWVKFRRREYFVSRGIHAGPVCDDIPGGSRDAERGADDQAVVHPSSEACHRGHPSSSPSTGLHSVRGTARSTATGSTCSTGGCVREGRRALRGDRRGSYGASRTLSSASPRARPGTLPRLPELGQQL